MLKSPCVWNDSNWPYWQDDLAERQHSTMVFQHATLFFHGNLFGVPRRQRKKNTNTLLCHFWFKLTKTSPVTSDSRFLVNSHKCLSPTVRCAFSQPLNRNAFTQGKYNRISNRMQRACLRYNSATNGLGSPISANAAHSGPTAPILKEVL